MSQDVIDRIVKEAKEERGSNPMSRKIRSIVQGEELTRINKYSEGFCYGCGSNDHVISSLFYICKNCFDNHGREGLLAMVTQIPKEELCDFCGYYRHTVRQINASLCKARCMERVSRIHAKYRKAGGVQNLHPFIKKMKKKYGKDYKSILGTGVSRTKF